MPRSSLALLFLLLLIHLVSAQTPAQPCDENACQLPHCRCASVNIPGDLLSLDTPQIVTISFDDSFRTLDYDTYYNPIFRGRKNPNGCQIGLTFFNSHSYTDYSAVEHAHFNGSHEFASHSITHRTPNTWWKTANEEDLKSEILGQKSMLNLWGGIPSDRVKGFRGPYLVTSENELKVLHENGFLYDASMSSAIPYWPFTLDYKSPICNSPATCPDHSYPGLWIIPHQFYEQSSGFTCSVIDACTAPFTEDDWLQFLVDNFFKHYNGNRSPFGIYGHSAWFIGWQWRVNAMNRFLDMLDQMDDVYVVTQSQMLDWVRAPTPLNGILDFSPWQCAAPEAPRCVYNKLPTPCQTAYITPQYFSFKSCTSPCPENYPDIGNPQGL